MTANPSGEPASATRNTSGEPASATRNTSGEPASATRSTAGRFVGQAVRRKEDPRLLTGLGTYVDDVVVPGMVHAAFVRSHVARGRIVGLNVGEARALDGVVAVLTATELNERAGSFQPTMFLNDPANAPLRALAEHDVRFVGEPVAVVLARSRYIAEDAVDLVELDIDPEPAVVDAEEALAGPTGVVHAERNSNLAMEMVIPNPAWDEVRAQAAHVVSETFHQHRQTPCPMETRGIVAQYDPAMDELTCWMSTQNPHEARLCFSRVCGLPEHRIRVSGRDVGGGFGQKMFTPHDEAVIALAACVTGRTVKWIEDRRENLIASNHARVDRTRVELALDAEGRFLGAYVDELEDCGAFPVGSTGGAASAVGAFFPGPYRIPVLGWEARSVWTNTCQRGAYRGPWMMETVAREQMVDVAARAIGMDPLDLRRRNTLRAEDLPHTTAMGMTYDASITPMGTLEQAADLIGYDEFRTLQQQAFAEEGRLLGIGLAAYVEPCANGMMDPLSTDTATVRVHPDGTATVALGSGNHGQGIETTMAQVVAEELGLDYEQVRVVQGDTAVSPFGRGTGGSGTAIVGANACAAAAADVRTKAAQIAAHLLEANPDDIETTDGGLAVRGTPSARVDWSDLARIAHFETARLPAGMLPHLEAVHTYRAPMVTWANATHAVTVEVDRHTGAVRILRYVVSEDAGRLINPMIVEGQIAGGVVQGIAGALFEHIVYDEDGNPLTTTFMDYLVPTASEIPTIEYGHLETPAPNPGGYKGVGEGGAIGAPPAIFNAVSDALALVGARITRQPCGPQQVLDALDAVGY